MYNPANSKRPVRKSALACLLVAAAISTLFLCALRTGWGRRAFDHFKLVMPLAAPVFRKVAISRFSRTLGTLLGSGVPVLQALTIVKETAGNVVVGAVISEVHQQVKEGEPIAPGLKASGVFPAMVTGMVDVGEQTGALPEMLLKIADTYDDEVDNSVTAMTSLLEPIMIVFLALIVGSIVVALFLPLVSFSPPSDGSGPAGPADNLGTRYSRSLESMMIVTGPSLVRLTSMCAPNSPVWIGLPRSSASRRANCSYSDTAISRPADRL